MDKVLTSVSLSCLADMGESHWWTLMNLLGSILSVDLVVCVVTSEMDEGGVEAGTSSAPPDSSSTTISPATGRGRYIATHHYPITQRPKAFLTSAS